MLPILLKFGPITIYTFGFFLFLSVILASFIIWKKARKIGLPEEKIFDTFLLTVFFSLIGGRIGYVLTHWSTFGIDLSRVLILGHYPGLSFQGAFLAGLVTVVLIAKLLELEWLKILDIFTVAFSWAIVFGSLGCVFDGCLANVVAARLLTVYLLILAVLLSLVSRQVDRSVNLAFLSRRPGYLFSGYLIFLTASFLILPKARKGTETVLYLAVLILSAAFFVWRYNRLFKMVKFPASVLTQIKAHLEAKNKQVEENLKDLKKEDPFEDNSRLLDRASDDSEAQSKFGHERVAAMQQQLHLVLVQTRKALTKIKLGKYGICESCGKMIDTDRLAAMPTATLCLNCEKKRER